MTLLESIVAFVVLALVGLACLDLSRGALALERSSVEWTVGVARAEAALSAAEAGVTMPAPSFGSGDAPSSDLLSRDVSSRDAATGDAAAVVMAPVATTTRAWRGSLDVVEVVVPLANGKEFVLHRIVRQSGRAARVAAGSGVTR
jgi:hypothetical protein